MGMINEDETQHLEGDSQLMETGLLCPPSLSIIVRDLPEFDCMSVEQSPELGEGGLLLG